MRALIGHLFYRSAWAQPHTVVSDTITRELQRTLFYLSAWPKPDIVVVGSKVEGPHVSFVLCDVRHCVGGNDR